MKLTTKQLMLGTGMLAAGGLALGAATVAASDYMVRLALDRKGVRSFDKKVARVAGATMDPTILARMHYKGRQLALACTDAQVITRDGLTLVGHWRGHEAPQRAIIAMHGWRSGWARDFGLIADFWHRSGCAVLYPEQRGQGSSQGDYIGFGLLERHDCRVWIDWVNEKTGGQLPIYLAGVSMGATTVLMTAGMDLPENVHGIIADCGFTSADAIWKHVAKQNLHLHYGLYAGRANRQCRKRIQVGSREYSTLDAMADCDVPVLLIHGTDDRFVPVAMTYENYKACNAPKHLLVVPGANHGMSYAMEQKRYEQTMLDFFSRYDRKTPAR